MWALNIPQESIGRLQINYLADGPMKDEALSVVKHVLNKYKKSFMKEYNL